MLSNVEAFEMFDRFCVVHFQQAHSVLVRVVVIETQTQTESDQSMLR